MLPEYCVEFRGRQIENGVIGLVHARDDERVQKAPNASGSPAALDVVERDVPEFYRLTPLGRKRLAAERSKWEAFSRALALILNSVDEVTQ